MVKVALLCLLIVLIVVALYRLGGYMFALSLECDRRLRWRHTGRQRYQVALGIRRTDGDAGGPRPGPPMPTIAYGPVIVEAESNTEALRLAQVMASAAGLTAAALGDSWSVESEPQLVLPAWADRLVDRGIARVHRR